MRNVWIYAFFFSDFCLLQLKLVNYKGMLTQEVEYSRNSRDSNIVEWATAIFLAN